MEIRDEQTVGDMLAHGFGNAITLIAHHNDAVLGKGLLVDVVTIEQGSVDGEVLWQLVEKLDQVSINNMYVRKASHRGLYYFGIVSIGRIFAAINGVNAKPVGYADNGAEVAGILNAVESQRK